MLSDLVWFILGYVALVPTISSPRAHLEWSRKESKYNVERKEDKMVF